MQEQIAKDRQAIADAKEAQAESIVETVFGVLLAPFSEGASLILAGIGAASIAEAESKIAGLQATIANYQNQITAYQGQFSDDQKQVACLQGLTLSTAMALNDMQQIELALDTLRTSWTQLEDDLNDVTNKLSNAATKQDLLVQRAWYESACGKMGTVVSLAAELKAKPVSTQHHSTEMADKY